MHSSNRNPFSERSWLSCFGESSEILSMTYVVLKECLYDPIDCVCKARGSNRTGESIQKRQFFSIILLLLYITIILVLVSDPGSASPFFRDELLAPVLHFVSVTEEKGGSAGRGLYHERSKEVNLLQIYNIDSGNAMELDPHVDLNESVFSRR